MISDTTKQRLAAAITAFVDESVKGLLAMTKSSTQPGPSPLEGSDALLRVREVATRHGVCEERVRQLLRSGRIHGVRTPTLGQWMVPESELQRLTKRGRHA